MADSRIAMVTVRGEGQLEVPPDRATLSVTVHATGGSADAVRQQLARSSASLGEVLTEHAAAIARSSTSGLHVSPVFKGGTRITGYRGVNSWSVELGDFDALSDLVSALLRLPESQLNGPWWSLSAEHPAHREARLAAIADARRRAEDYAGAVGMDLADLVEVSDLEANGFGPSMRMAAPAGMGGGAVPDFDFEPAVQTVTGRVTVRYRLQK